MSATIPTPFFLTGRPPGRFVRAGIRFYKRFLTQHTPACSQTPCCSDFAMEHGLRMAWFRMRDHLRASAGNVPIPGQGCTAMPWPDQSCQDNCMSVAGVKDYGPDSCWYGFCDPRSSVDARGCCGGSGGGSGLLGRLMASLIMAALMLCFEGQFPGPWPAGKPGCEYT